MTGRWKVALVGLGGLVVAAALADPAGARTALAAAGCLLLPGLGWARKMRFSDRGDTVALAVVLSICATTAVGTAMAVADAWSLGWGLAVLALVAAAGFAPTGALVDRAQAAAQRRITRFADDGGAWAAWSAQNAQQARRRATAAADVWGDWYADVERRAAEERARQDAAVEQAEAEWTAWHEHSRGRG